MSLVIEVMLPRVSLLSLVRSCRPRPYASGALKARSYLDTSLHMATLLSFCSFIV